jgi:hypothetical protein
VSEKRYQEVMKKKLNDVNDWELLEVLAPAITYVSDNPTGCSGCRLCKP